LKSDRQPAHKIEHKISTKKQNTKSKTASMGNEEKNSSEVGESLVEASKK